MQLITGDLWTAKTDLIAVTTNSKLRRDGCLVMGRGAALEAKTHYPQLPALAGERIAATCGSGGLYGFLIIRVAPGKGIGLFQVKLHWQDAARLDVIAAAVDTVLAWCERHPTKTLAINYPGIGNGRLHLGQVQPLIAKLPNQVFIYQKERTDA